MYREKEFGKHYARNIMSGKQLYGAVLRGGYTKKDVGNRLQNGGNILQ